MSAKKIVIKEILLILLLTALSVVSLYHVREVFFSLKNLIPKEDIEAFISFLIFLCSFAALVSSIINARAILKAEEPVIDWTITSTKVHGVFLLTISFLDVKHPLYLEEIKCKGFIFDNAPSNSSVIKLDKKIPSTRFQQLEPEKYKIHIPFRLRNTNRVCSVLHFTVLEGNLPKLKLKVFI